DTLCIDQPNVLERNQQVALMGRVYPRASEVLIWLGPASRNLTRAMTFLKDTDFVPYRWPENCPSTILKDIPFEGMKELTKHPYWTRAVTFYDISVLCKMYEAPWLLAQYHQTHVIGEQELPSG
ncbi:hypothetical protein BU25DRAFT_354614, partial [Macroventuria anomochaeta]